MSRQPDLFDTHAHLHDPWIGDDLTEVLERASEASVGWMVSIGTDLPTTRDAIALANSHDNIWATVGLHPHDAKDWDADLESEFRRLAANDRVVAIGEIGLDFYRNLSSPEAQYAAFEAQLTLADELDLPVVIHSRDAHEESYGLLKDWVQSNSPSVERGQRSPNVRGGPDDRRQPPVGVIHCFSGDADLACRYYELGFLISFAGPVTYPRNDALREAAASLPLEAIVIETDCPYLSPQPRRGKRNEPAHIQYTIEQIAQARPESIQAIAENTTHNAHRLFRL